MNHFREFTTEREAEVPRAPHAMETHRPPPPTPSRVTATEARGEAFRPTKPAAIKPMQTLPITDLRRSKELRAEPKQPDSLQSQPAVIGKSQSETPRPPAPGIRAEFIRETAPPPAKEFSPGASLRERH